MLHEDLSLYPAEKLLRHAAELVGYEEHAALFADEEGNLYRKEAEDPHVFEPGDVEDADSPYMERVSPPEKGAL